MKLQPVKVQGQVGQKVKGQQVKVNTQGSDSLQSTHGSSGQGSKLMVSVDTWRIQVLTNVFAWLVYFGPILRRHVAHSGKATWPCHIVQFFLRIDQANQTRFEPMTYPQIVSCLTTTSLVALVTCSEDVLFKVYR